MRTAALALLALAFALLPHRALAAPCTASSSPALLDARFTTAVRTRQAVDMAAWLVPGQQEIYVFATTRGAGKVNYRWFVDGNRHADTGATVGNGTWRTWSRLFLPRPLPQEVRVRITGANGCLLRELSIASTAYADHPELQAARRALAAGDARAARNRLRLLLLEGRPAAGIAREANRLLDNEVAVAMAADRLAAGELFLVDESLRQVERRLGRRAHDDALRARIDAVRREKSRRLAALDRESAFTLLGVRGVLEAEKLVYGDYPLLREDAERILLPALAQAGDHYALLDWQPTLRGYRLQLQDRRSGNTYELTPQDQASLR